MVQNHESSADEVYGRVATSIEDQDVRELWQKIRSELMREGGGPDACLAYLESELTRMEEVVRRGLDRLEKL